jgi:mannitol-1-/sugar-/sorbitol-6-phosphatase
MPLSAAPDEPLIARALLLDMDGTLVDSDAVVARVWRGWATAHGLDPERVLARAHGRQGYVTMAEFLPERPMDVNHRENRELLRQETADTAGIVPVPGAPEFLAALAALAVPHALVTSADAALADARMRAAGLAMPRTRVTAEDVGASKPDPEGFSKGAAALGFAPADCAAFEDSGAGIAAAQAAGVRVVGVGPRAAAHAPTCCVPDLTGLRITPHGDGGFALHIAA